MTELLVHPYRASDDRQIDEFYALLSTYPNLEWVPPSLEIADEAAKIQLIFGCKLPDDLQAATAIHWAAQDLSQTMQSSNDCQY